MFQNILLYGIQHIHINAFVKKQPQNLTFALNYQSSRGSTLLSFHFYIL